MSSPASRDDWPAAPLGVPGWDEFVAARERFLAARSQGTDPTRPERPPMRPARAQPADSPLSDRLPVQGSRYVVAALEDMERLPAAGTLAWTPIRRALGVSAFGINAYTAAAAEDEVVESHDETGTGAGGHEELYIVLRGRASFELEGEEFDAPQGTFVFIPDPTVRRYALAREAGTVVLTVLGPPQSDFRPSP
jgi:AraC-like ligand binding domain